MPSRSRYVGQTLTEYIMIGAFILLAAIPAAVMLGGNLNNLFGNMLDSSWADNKEAQITAAAGAQSTDASSIKSPGSSTAAMNSTYAPTLQEALTKPLTTTVQTAGVNGATSLMADAIKEVSAKALENGTITEEQYNQLVALSNQGHRLGEIADVLNKAAKNANGSTENFNDQKVIFDGQSMTASELWATIGFDVPDWATVSDPLNQGAIAYGEAETFINLYQSLNQSGALADPALKQMVTTASENILYINDSFDTAITLALGDPVKLSSVQETTASELLHAEAKTICTAGNASDTGTYCSGSAAPTVASKS